MFYLVMAILTGLGVAIGYAVYTKDKTPEPVEYVAMITCALLGAMMWPLTFVVAAMLGVFWITRDFMKKPEVQIPTVKEEGE